MQRHEKNNRLVSVIIPTRNRPYLLRRAVQSVLEQSYSPLEILIIDDNSDEAVNLDLPCSRTYNIRIIRNKECRGVAASRNIGIEKAKEYYRQFLDDDDSWLPDKLTSQISCLEKQSSPLTQGVFCQMIRVDENGKQIGLTNFPSCGKALLDSIIFRDGNIPPQTMVVCRKVFRTAGFFNEELPSFEDREWSLRYLSSFEIVLDQNYLVRYMEHSGSRLTTDSSKMLKGEMLFINIIKKNLRYSSKRRFRKSLGYRHSKLANEHLLNDSFFLGLKNYLYAIYLYPFDTRPFIGFFIALGGINFYKRVISLRMPRVRLSEKRLKAERSLSN